VFISIPKEDKNFFGRLLNEVRRNFTLQSSVAGRGQGNGLSHPLGGEKALPKNACRPKAVSISVEKISVLSVSSVARKKQRNQRNLRQKNSFQLVLIPV
jgi:hypothetical protein